MAAPPQRLDVYLQGLGAFQENAATLNAGDPLCLQQLDCGRLVCATQSGAAVGLVPADKRALLTRGPWSGIVRSVKRQPAAASGAAACEASPAAPDDTATAGAADLPAPAAAGAAAEHLGLEQQQQQQQHSKEETQQQQQEAMESTRPPGEQQQQQAGAAAAPAAPAESGAQQEQQEGDPQGPSHPTAAVSQHVVVQLLVRFSPEEQRWLQRGQEGAPAAPLEEDAALLSTEQFHALAASEELQWMLRDERLQKVVAEVDGAPDRERALLRALQAPNFKEFADKVLAVVAPEPST